MKKLLLILLFVPLVSFGQAKDELMLCMAIQSTSFTSNSEADKALDRILNVIGVSKNFVLTPCSEINNAMAASFRGNRYILYDKEFMKLINSRTNDWSSIFILAHEVGHHINGHSLDFLLYDQVEPKDISIRRNQELEADEFAGFILSKLGASLNQAIQLTNIFPVEEDKFRVHPNRSKRQNAIKNGYEKSNSKIQIESKISLAEKYKNSAMEKDSNGDFKGAIDDLTVSLALKPDPSGFLIRGHIYGAIKDWDNAIKDYDQSILLDNYPKEWPSLTANAYFMGGLILKFSGNLNKAISYYEKCIENLNYHLPEVYFELGNLYYDKKQNEDAIKYLKVALEISLDNNSTSSSIFSDKKFDKKKIIESYYKTAVSYANMGDSKNAIEYFNRVLKNDNERLFRLDDIYYFIAQEKYKLKDYYGVISDYTKVLEISPNDTDVISKIAAAKDDLGDYKGAIADYSKVIELEPDSAAAYFYRGLAKENLKDYYGAIADYSEVIELNPVSAAAYYSRGFAKQNLKDYKGAISDYSKVIELEPDSAWAYSNRGISKENIGDSNGACQDWRKSATLGHPNANQWVKDQCS